MTSGPAGSCVMPWSCRGMSGPGRAGPGWLAGTGRAACCAACPHPPIRPLWLGSPRVWPGCMASWTGLPQPASRRPGRFGHSAATPGQWPRARCGSSSPSCPARWWAGSASRRWRTSALLGRYHQAVCQFEAPGQRPGALPIAAVPAVLRPPRLRAAGVDPGRAAVICELAGELARDLAGAASLASPPVVVHGDFTNHNVLADGTPPRITGVIEAPVADIGYGLWRSGRPYQHADHLDLSRVRRFLRGYASTAPIPADAARLIPVYLYGRGLQMIAKRIRAGRPETGMLAQVSWLSANAGALADTCAHSLT